MITELIVINVIKEMMYYQVCLMGVMIGHRCAYLFGVKLITCGSDEERRK